MLTLTFYVFAFITWGVGLLVALAWAGYYLKQIQLTNGLLQLKLTQANFGHEQLIKHVAAVNSGGGGDIRPGAGMDPLMLERLNQMKSASPNHPEIGEIDDTDQIVGVLFKGENYPPEFDDDDDDNY